MKYICIDKTIYKIPDRLFNDFWTANENIEVEDPQPSDMLSFKKAIQEIKSRKPILRVDYVMV